MTSTTATNMTANAETANADRLFEGADWDFPTLQRIHDACEECHRVYVLGEAPKP